MRVVIVPLTMETENQHKYFFESAYVNVIIKNNKVIRLKHNKKHTLYTNDIRLFIHPRYHCRGDSFIVFKI